MLPTWCEGGLVTHAGFFFGRTPLIKLSPKKTWEGFFGGLVLTVVSSWYLAEFMSRYKWMICPRTVSTHCHPQTPKSAVETSVSDIAI